MLSTPTKPLKYAKPRHSASSFQPSRIARVAARFPGPVRRLTAHVGDQLVDVVVGETVLYDPEGRRRDG